MEIRIFTLPFDGISESFPDEIVREFCQNKRVIEVKAHLREESIKLSKSLILWLQI
jgi:hypothetical protein